MRRPLLIVLLSAACVHVAFLVLAHSRLQPHYFDSSASLETNTRNAISSDASVYYGRYAEMILQRGAYETESGPVTNHMPGIPVLLALSKALTGNLALYGLVQLLALFVGVYYFCRHAMATYPRWVVTLSAGLLLLHPLLIYSSWTVNSEALFLAAFLPALSLLTRAEGDARRLVRAAILLGVATYFREIGLVMAVCAAFSLIRFRRSSLRLALQFFAAFLAILAPWVIRNYVSTGELILTTTKGARIFFLSSLGMTGEILNPMDAGEGGLIDYDALRERSRDFLEAHGVEPGQTPPEGFYLRHGIENYLSHPGMQARSILIKAANMLRPSVARRHLDRLLPGWISVAAYWLLAAQHAALLWVGLVVLFRRRSARDGCLRWMIVGSGLVILALWAEPRYLLPFYLPTFIAAIDWYRTLVITRS